MVICGDATIVQTINTRRDATHYYHVISRCVRRAFLCGQDQLTGKSFEHRRRWIEANLEQLSTVFFIEIAAYAILSDHYHLVLHVNKSAAKKADKRDIIKRWHQRFSGVETSHKYLAYEALEPQEKDQLSALVETWRARLFDISWMMRTLNETNARKANLEDDCTGRFREGRFKSIPLLDDKALLSCLSYVDLNPIRAGLASTPESSDHTSIKQRAKFFSDGNHHQPDHLMPFTGLRLQTDSPDIAFTLSDYLELVDWTGRQIRDKPTGNISSDAPPILDRLNISPNHWIYLSTEFESRFKGVAGTAESLKRSLKKFGLIRRSSLKNSRLLFS